MNKYFKKIIQEAVIQKIRTSADLNAVKRKMAKKYGQPCPGNFILLKIYRQMVHKGLLPRQENLENLLRTRPVRTLSGIAAITVLTKPYPCPGQCIYCPNEIEMPKSYLKNEPAAQRAYLTKFEPRRQVEVRLQSLQATGHNTEKIELIILGGTFPAYPKAYQKDFVQKCFAALNEKQAPSLACAQKSNEKAKHRCVGLSIETRPDQVNLQNIRWWRQLGVTRVELGVQTVFDDLLKKCKRGHTVADVAQATRLLKDWGFKVVYHIMPNLPGAIPQKDLEGFQKLFADSRFQPDQVKIYPLVVLESAPLYKIWKKGQFKPYTAPVLHNLLIKIKRTVPLYVRIIRLIRDIPAPSIVAGNKITNLRQIIQNEKVLCHCIRCREAKAAAMGKIYYFQKVYAASSGWEYYLSFENKAQEILYAHLRLRLPSPKSFLANIALIREVHTYGRVASLRQPETKNIQHQGLGKKLMHKAENLARASGYQKIAVISGIGVRDYYRKLGYRLGKEGYMYKNL